MDAIPRRAMVKSWAVVVLTLTACSTRTVDAVVGGPETDGGLDAGVDSGVDAGIDSGVDAGVDASTGTDAATVWPNDESRTNSDPWLVAHHDELRELRPRVLVLSFINDLEVAAVADAAQEVIAGLAEGSRYRAYRDASAPPFLRYELAGVIDLTDDPVPADWTHTSSTRLPVTASGAFDMAALFDASFAANYGYEDPAQPGRPLDLCGLFSEGLVNELWLAVGESGPRHPPQVRECKARYDASGARVEGAFVDVEGGDFCDLAARCGVTVRIAHLNPMRGVGCDLDIRAWLLRGAWRALPRLEPALRAFMNSDFRTRFDAPFDSLLEICLGVDGDCVRYPASDVIEGELPSGTTWRIDPYEPGCGDPEFPPNARFFLDDANTAPVQSRCAGFGLGGGPGGRDVYEPYSADTVDELDQRWGRDCAGGWQVYLRQSIPGLDNRGVDADGAPLRNWWVYSFY